MNEIVKKWRDNNEDKVKFQKKREKIRKTLRKNNLLPKIGEEPNDQQKIILKQISENDFSYYENFKLERTKNTKTYRKRVHKDFERPVLKKSRITYELRVCGILPKLGEPLNEEQTEILNYVNENYEIPIKSFITKYRHLIPPKHQIWYRTLINVQNRKSRRHGDEHFNITVEDIIIPEYCPYLGVRLSTDINDSSSPNYCTIDRIDSSKGYIKGNVQIISRLANTMKNNSTIDELITFAKNVIKIHNS